MAETHVTHESHPATASWVATALISIVLFLALWGTTLYVGHTLAGGATGH